MNFIRKLFGYNIIQGKKKYTQKGILSEINGEKLQNSIIISLSYQNKTIKLFRKNKIPIKIRRIWSE